MSQSPTKPSETGQTRRYLAGWEALRRLIDKGKSISGRERHCCFLNTGDSRFADVSAVTGLDLIDDGRAAALVDWDHDGDQDLWLTNRTSPMIRFLRNDFQSGNHFVAIRLVARDGNRDAIGARVELHLDSDARPNSVKTLRAGNGFMAQSSKWLYFGLGQADQIHRIVVHWPGGESETYRGVAVDSRVRVVQGSERPIQVAAEREPVRLDPAEVPEPSAEATFRVVMLPGSGPLLTNVGRGPILVTLWAGWCQPCILELKELTEREADLRAAGLKVQAFNVENVDSLGQGDSDSVGRLLEQIQFPFSTSQADSHTMAMFETSRKELVDKPGPFALPTSFLLDEQGRIRVMYRGRVKVDQLLSDISLLRSSPSEVRDAAVPFAGKWMGLPPGLAPNGKSLPRGSD